jgi:hypothetical protein
MSPEKEGFLRKRRKSREKEGFMEEFFFPEG